MEKDTVKVFSLLFVCFIEDMGNNWGIICQFFFSSPLKSLVTQPCLSPKKSAGIVLRHAGFGIHLPTIAGGKIFLFIAFLH